MKVFLSWSGGLSHNVSIVFRDWLPSVIQSVDPYVSSEDIDKGARWSTDIAKELEESSYGILCVTKENIDAPWLNFEAGALSKAFEKLNVSPFLFDVKRSEIKAGPLLQFQSTIYSKSDVYKLIKGINKALADSALPEERLKSIFDVWWPELDEKLKHIVTEEPNEKEKKTKEKVKEEPSNEILEEILELTRTHQRLLRSPEEIFPPEYFRHIIDRYGLGKNIHPGAMRDLRITLKELKSLISDSKENNKRTVPLKAVEGIMEMLNRPIRHMERSSRELRRSRSLFDDDL